MAPVLRRLNEMAESLPIVVPVWGFRLTVPTFDRALYASLHCLGAMGQASRAWLAEHVQPGMTCVDVGANVGLYSLEMSRLTGETGSVHSFEPDARLFRALRKNCERAKRGAPIFSNERAVADRSGTANLRRGLLNSGDNRLDDSGGEGETIRLVRLDEAIEAEIDFIKIDVQGHEPAVLNGMKGILKRQERPLLVRMEFWPRGLREAGHDPRAFLDELLQSGWTCQTDERESVSDEMIENLSRTGKFIDLTLTHPCLSEASSETKEAT